MSHPKRSKTHILLSLSIDCNPVDPPNILDLAHGLILLYINIGRYLCTLLGGAIEAAKFIGLDWAQFCLTNMFPSEIVHLCFATTTRRTIVGWKFWSCNSITAILQRNYCNSEFLKKYIISPQPTAATAIEDQRFAITVKPIGPQRHLLTDFSLANVNILINPSIDRSISDNHANPSINSCGTINT